MSKIYPLLSTRGRFKHSLQSFYITETMADDGFDEDLSVSVVDVYDLASEIGKEFEKLIDHFGTDSVTSLMPKVIGALEQLEALATRNERENTIVEELRSRIVQLETEKIEKAEDRQRFEKELEQIEDNWREESRELVALVTKLQDENRKLVERRDAEAAQAGHSMEDLSPLISDREMISSLQRLKGIIEQQREQIRQRDRDMTARSAEIENLTSQVERLTCIGKDLRRKHRTAINQVRTLIEERADFLAQMQDQKRHIAQLKQRLGLAHKENEDLAKAQNDLPDLTNKAIFDIDDPNRPRFTTAELKEILHERNQLKARVSDLEDELEAYRPKPLPQSWPFRGPLGFQTNSKPSSGARGSSRYPPESLISKIFPEEEDPPVQGPLPYEPDDAPWRKNESGIRKFFRKLFSESNVTFLGSSPKRSLSSLSKMALSSTTTYDNV